MLQFTETVKLSSQQEDKIPYNVKDEEGSTSKNTMRPFFKGFVRKYMGKWINIFYEKEQETNQIKHTFEQSDTQEQ